ncbi:MULTISPECIES: GNAT family N-acetyltransferase [Rhizobium]|uniref:N-acetyltransferase n=1 Tax=Rhizobium sophoriradicis TaxID=1535245 RepID=A0A2A5KVU2_9HYPH|nr:MULTISPECIES: GNAT family N-acetyltransferase [Rhizobium]ARQ58271.1 GCN5-related N-acetyltransferase protein [Rhizobium sp. Kim5]PCK81162.1 N-acetyltransferase [Rhizobium sophoriradicis]RSC20707.1 GNAT family N-acetyltransferase [Rhizobium sophoriradicis]UWU36434.1 GNAT family N-acetyltransferase [Rhizobium leguminosarum bv. phaseoli]
MTMRLASRDDLQTITTLTAAAYLPHTELFGVPPVPATEDYVPRIERGEVWLREIGDETVGLVFVEQHPDHLMLFSIGVSPAFQGAGHGLAMLRWLKGKAREWATPQIRLYTNARMERNVALYRAFGFQETGRRQKPYRPGWTLVDMAKEIVAA